MDTKPADHRKSKRDFRYAESQLRNLNTKIDKLLNKLDEKEQDEAKTPEEECVICVNSKATMQTWPCGHRVVCRKCLVRTIQMAVSRRSLPLRCVVCRARVLRLKRSSDAAASPAARGGGRDAAATAADTAAATTDAAAGRSHSLPIKLRRHATTVAAAAVRSRSVGTAKTAGERLRRQLRRRRRHDFAAGWADVLAADGRDGHYDRDRDGRDGGDDGCEADGGDGYDHYEADDGGGDDDGDDESDDDNSDDDEDDRGRTTAIKYRKLDTSDRKHGNQTKNGLQRILGKLKFWRYLRVKNNKS